jgi:superfamily II DNA or RNA helicase
MNNGYFYVRLHESYYKYDACKIGITNNIPDRDSQYATSEIKRGNFYLVFEIHNKMSKEIETAIHKKFEELHIKFNSGTEFYNKKIIPLIEPYLIELGIKYELLSKEDIANLIRCYRLRKLRIKIKLRKLIVMQKSKRTNKEVISYLPRNDQTMFIDNSVIHFQENNKGMLVLMCGVGKTLISLWIGQKLKPNTILIGVPNILLLKQWEKDIKIIFPDVKLLLVSCGVDIKDIIKFLKHNKKCIIVVTYASSCKVYDATNKINLVFDFKVNDEVHHLTTNNLNKEGKTYVNMLKIKSKKELSLTATKKILENQENKREEDIVVSNDNIEQFGKIIDEKNLLWAINENIICDYVIQAIITNEEKLEKQLEKLNIIDDNNKRLFLAAYAALKSIYDGHSHHILVYLNKQKNCEKMVEYINALIDDNYFELPDLSYSYYHSGDSMDINNEKLKKFKQAKYGIMACVYCLGEGWDLPLLDAVVFAENMTSIIRIVQSALRAIRKDKNAPNKITKIILPILNRDDWLENNENPDFKKTREVIYQMGLEDEIIEQKIKVSWMDIKKQKSKKIVNGETERFDEFGEYDDDLTDKLILKTVKRTTLATTYEKARKIIINENIKSKEDYYELCERDNRLPINPEEQFKSKFTNWIEYLSIERVYYNLEICKNKVSEYLLLYPEIKQHYLNLSILSNELCKIDDLFPPNGLWVEYYNVKDLRDIITITNKKKKLGAIL